MIPCETVIVPAVVFILHGAAKVPHRDEHAFVEVFSVPDAHDGEADLADAEVSCGWL